MTGEPNTLERKKLLRGRRLLIEEGLRSLAVGSKDVIAPRTLGAPTPISVEQHSIWLHAAMDPDLPIYNESFTIHRSGSFDLKVLEAAFNEILKRHEIWRTSFSMQGDEFMQVIEPELTVSLPLIDLSTMIEDEQESEAARLATESAILPIDLTRSPLFRARVLRLSPTYHQLQLTMHHIIFDGISIHQIFMPELSALYTAFSRGDSSPLPDPILQYGDYAVWRQRQLETPKMAAHLEFWRKKLSGELPILRLPTNRPRAALTNHRGAVEYSVLPAELMNSLRALARTNNVSMYMTLLAGLKVLFFRYSGQEDVIVGSLADGRHRPEFASVMGYFLNIFAIRTRPQPELTGSEYLVQVRNAVLEGLEAAHVPFSRVVKEVERRRDSSHESIFQTFFCFQPQASTFAQGWDMTKTQVDNGATKFDIYVEVDERPHETTVQFTYNREQFDTSAIRRMISHWVTLLTGLATEPDCSLGRLPLLSPEEREQMLVTWNQTEAPAPKAIVSEIVEAVAAQAPRTIAIEFEDQTCTYDELERRARRLAGHLRNAGAARGKIVALFLDRSENLPVALLATMKSGAAYLPLDPETPPARIQLCLDDAVPAVVLTQRSLRGDLQTDATVVLLEDALSTDPLTPFLAKPVSVDDPAYLIYTSGTTGRPKAVEVPHRALSNLLTSMQIEPGFTAADTLLAVTTIAFDIAGLELLLPLISGGRLVIASRKTALDPHLLSTAIKQTCCTVMQATPATWRGLLATGWRGNDKLRLLCGGEVLTRDLADALLPCGSELWNLYGPTETTIWSTAQRIAVGTDPISVGRPIANTVTYILDGQQQPVPVGVPGELYIGGLGLANGYRGQPELTEDKFVTHAIADGARLYRTGDNASYCADGTILVHGRSDNQVKVRGHRVELEDLEASLSKHPRVSACAARVWPDPSGDNRLCAYLVGVDQTPPDAAEMREFLGSQLPDYMIPSLVVAMNALPISSNGKVDRKALPPPDGAEASRSRLPAASRAPSSEQERRLATIWMDLLGVPSVSLDDNFFDIGGHSLLAARLQHRIASEFGRKISVAAIVHAPTIVRQIELLNETQSLGDPAHILPIQPRGSVQPLFWIEPFRLVESLATALGQEQPFLGVTMTLVDLEEMGSQPSMETIAKFYAENILRVQPQGPFYLGGFCTGGILAYAIAVHLQRAGHTVASLVLLDSENPAFYRRLGSFGTEINKLRFYLQRALLTGSLKEFSVRFKFRLRRLLRIPQPAPTEMSSIINAMFEAAFLYEPPAYDADVLLLLSEDRPSVVNFLTGWRVPIKGRLVCIEVKGHHDELFTKGYVEGIAQALMGKHPTSGSGTSWLPIGPG